MSNFTDFIYSDFDGKELYRKRKIELDNGHKTFKQGTIINGRFVPGIASAQQVPYRLDKLSQSQDETVYITEGEKDADCLAALGLTVTTASTPSLFRNHSPLFTGKQIIIFQDNDTAGEKKANRAARVLSRFALSVKVVNLCPHIARGDVADYLAAGSSLSDLKLRVEQQSYWTEPEQPKKSKQRHTGQAADGHAPFAGMTCLEYIEQYIGETKRAGSERRVKDFSGGLTVREELDSWHYHVEGIGGGLQQLIAWHLNISSTEAWLLAGKPGATERPQLEVKEDSLPGWAEGAALYPQPEQPQPQQPGSTGLYTAYAHKDEIGSQGLADELWPGFTEPIKESSYFTGQIPSNRAHSCKTHTLLEGDLNTATFGWKQFNQRLWRDRKIGAFTMIACSACRHEHVYRLIQQIEQEAGLYKPENMPYQYVILEEDEAKKVPSLIRSWRSRYDGQIKYWMRAMRDGNTAIIHNVSQPLTRNMGKRLQESCDKLQGEQLPSDRVELYELILDWIVLASDGNTSHSQGWGGSYAGCKGYGRKDEEKPREAIVQIVTERRDFEHAMEHLGHRGKLNQKGTKKESILAIYEALQQTGGRFGIKKGHFELITAIEEQQAADKDRFVTASGYQEREEKRICQRHDKPVQNSLFSAIGDDNWPEYEPGQART